MNTPRNIINTIERLRQDEAVATRLLGKMRDPRKVTYNPLRGVFTAFGWGKDSAWTLDFDERALLRDYLQDRATLAQEEVKRLEGLLQVRDEGGAR